MHLPRSVFSRKPRSILVVIASQQRQRRSQCQIDEDNEQDAPEYVRD